MSSSSFPLHNTEGGTDEKRGGHALEVGVGSERFPDLTTRQSRDSSLFADGKFVKSSLIQTLDDTPQGCLTLNNTKGRINWSRCVSGLKIGGCGERFPDLTTRQSRDSSLFPDGKSKTPFMYTLNDTPKGCLTHNNTKGRINWSGGVSGLKVGGCGERFPDLTTRQSRDSSLFPDGKFVKASLIQTLDDTPKACLTLNNTEGHINWSGGVSGLKVGGCGERFPDLTTRQSRDSSLFPDGKSKMPFMYTLDDSPKACLTLNNTEGGIVKRRDVDELNAGVCSERFPDHHSRDSSLFAEEKFVKECFIDTVDDSPKGKDGSGKKRAGIRGLFNRACKAVMRPFLNCRSNKVMPIVPPLKPDRSNSGLSVPYASGLEDSSDSGSYWLGHTPDACPADESAAKVWSVFDQTSYTDSEYYGEAHVLDTSDSMSASSDDSAGLRKGVERLMTYDSSESIGTINLDAQSGMKASSKAVKNRSSSFDSRSSEMTNDLSEATNLDFDNGMNNIAEICPEGQHAKENKKAGKWGSFKRTCKSVKQRLLTFCSNKVKPLVPPLLPDTCPSYQASHQSTYDDVESYYDLGNVLGEGLFGSVYEATRIADGQKVAIKFMFKYDDDRTIAIPGYSEPLNTEVALQIKMSEPPLSPNVIQMFESFENSEEIAIVMEYPKPCISLEDYISDNDILSEETARVLMRHAVHAVIDCIDHGVVHTDIHPGNILINTSTLDLKLIDFGCGQLFTKDAYDRSQYVGKQDYCPPEVIEMNRFHAISANVWNLGLLLYEMVNGSLPYTDSEKVLFLNPDLSGACRSIIRKCLARDPADRPTLQQILQHRWFNPE